MKIALYIEDGLEQIVLTPEGESERGILGKLTDNSRELLIRQGSFYTCRGGWKRQGYAGWDRTSDDASTMIVLRPKGSTPADGEAG